jgi:hypothetical protein
VLFFHRWSDLRHSLGSRPSPRWYPAYPSNSLSEPACSKRPLRTDYWDRPLGQVHNNESFTHTERSLHRIFRCIGINLWLYPQW